MGEEKTICKTGAVNLFPTVFSVQMGVLMNVFNLSTQEAEENGYL